MSFSPHLADRRFGIGLSPVIAPPDNVAAMLDGLTGPDAMAAAFPIPLFAGVTPGFDELRALRQTRTEGVAAEEAFVDGRRRMNAVRQTAFAHTLARGIRTSTGLRERLTRFWADHFTTVAMNALMPHLVTPYVEEAIRPNMTGRFVDLLVAAVTHPMMVIYLDQAQSVGPNSMAGQANGRGLNENLAREVLELHTLGVGGPYTQTDVRELAEALTGLSWTVEAGRVYRPRFAEPGAEVLLGQRLSAEADLATVVQALTVIADHPATARHIATKLAVHFVADVPEPALIDAMTAAFAGTGGDLMAVYAAMLDHPSAWADDMSVAKVMRPYDFVQSSLRALAAPVETLPRGLVNRALRLPLRDMGQEWERPAGPDGWDEAEGAWITPQGMAGRITWAMQAPSLLLGELPDPRAFAPVALGTVPEEVAFAAAAAEDRAVGIGLILCSARFQRRV